MSDSITKELLDNYLKGKCTNAELELVELWYASFDQEMPLFENEHSKEALELENNTKFHIDEHISEIIAIERITYGVEKQAVFSIDTHRKIFTWPKVAAAVMFILAASVSLVVMNKKKHKSITDIKIPSQQQQNVIVPGGNKAVLTLADGSTIILDNAGQGALFTQGGTRIVKLADGRIVYDAGQMSETSGPQQVSYNMLSTPRGAQYELVLPDGTKVWLNAASSIKYPTAFTGEKRMVEITGEVYFEIAKMAVQKSNQDVGKTKAMTFLVKARDMEVEVLGTHFNVNAYEEEQAIKTTLIEGSVKVVKGNKQVLIKPGEQAMLNAAGNIEVEGANVNKEVAWKNGMFQFENASIETVMQQVSRWYDVEVEYKTDVSADRFQGKLYRNTEISQLLKILELSGARFKIEGKKIIVQ